MWSNFKHTVLIAMGLFKPDAEETLQKTLDAAKSIAGRLVTAKTWLAERHATAIELARDNADDATLDEAKGKIRAAQIRVDTLSAALTETDQKILQLEQELVAVADRKQRKAAAFEIEMTAEGFASAAALACAIVFHAVWNPGAIVVTNPMQAVVRKSTVIAPAGLSRAAVESMVETAVKGAVAESDARGEKRARQLLAESEKRHDMERAEMMATINASFEVLSKRYNNLVRMTASADTGAPR